MLSRQKWNIKLPPERTGAGRGNDNMGVRFDNPHDLEEALARNPDLRLDAANFRKPGPVAKNNPALASLSPPKESETDFQKWEIDKLQEAGWRVHAERPAATKKTYTNKAGETKDIYVTAIQGDPGFPDVIATHEKVNYCLVIENKSMTGALSPNQEKWALAFARLPGFKVLVLRPDERAEFLKIVEVE